MIALPLILLSTLTLNPGPTGCSGMPDPKAASAVPNDNRAQAGTLSNGVLTVRLVARPAAWYPEGKEGCGIRVHAFAEEGKAAQIPGPLIRVRVGTEVHIQLRNELGRPLKIRGLYGRTDSPARPGLGVDEGSVEIPIGESRELAFRATTPGSFYYWGITPIDMVEAYPRRVAGDPLPSFSPFEDGQLVGALIVDPREGSPPDRVFVITLFVRPGAKLDERAVSEINSINGLSWPHTEQLTSTVGEKLRWRVLNASIAPHTMHLHGFYFNVVSQGQAAVDSALPPAAQRMVVSEFMQPGRTITMEWQPQRAGNWLFHCHWLAHMGAAQRIDRVFGLTSRKSDNHGNHDDHNMAGLVMGISVKPRGKALAMKASDPERRLRLFASERPHVFGDDPGYGFVLQDGATAPAVDSIRIPGSPIILTRGQATEITVFNRLHFPLGVHWHGIELESYYDGVPGFSGVTHRTASAIAPGDSFVVRMTPPRAGTFFYHIHSEESNELNSGLYGSLLVLEPGQRLDDAVDRTFVLSAGGRAATPTQVIFVNGTTRPEPIEMTVGRTQRWRFIGIPANGQFDVRIIGGSATQVWRQVARDGAELPPQQVVERPAQTRIPVGITMDFEITPSAAGDYALQVDLMRGPTALAGIATKMPIRVIR